MNEHTAIEAPRKTCRKCGISLPATLDNFYRNSGGKYGVTPRCKSCVNEDNKAGHAKRLAADPERIRALATARTKKHHRKNLEASRAYKRKKHAEYRADPDRYRLIQARKRGGGAGLTPEEIEAMFQAQGCVCAICGSDDPGSKGGWHLDHCHKTNHVRFILCAHCNRGLGAFRDRPEFMRKAADMLEQFNQNQSMEPTHAIFG